MTEKRCPRCELTKPPEEFYKDSKKKDGLRCYCKKCSSEICRKRRQENPEKYKEIDRKSREKNSEKHREKCRRWREENPEKQREHKLKSQKRNPESKKERQRRYRENNPDKIREWYIKNKELVLEKSRQWREDNREQYRETKRKYRKWKRDSDVLYKLKDDMRCQLRRVLYKGEGETTEGLLGYSPFQLKQRLESQFQPGMSWENYGEVWEIDHRIPMQRLFDRGEYRAHIVNALSNLRPLWVRENRSRKNYE